MKGFNKILYFLIGIYMMILPLTPSKFSLKGIPFNGDTVLFLILLIYLMSLIVSTGSRKRFAKGLRAFFTDSLGIFIILVAAVMLYSVTYSFDKKLALNETFRFITYAALFFIISYEVPIDKTKQYLLNVYTIVCVIVSSIGIVQNILLFYTKNNIGDELRITSTLENANNLGAFLVISLFPFIMTALYHKNKKKRVLFASAALLSLISIALSGSRNALIGVAIGFVILIIIYSYKLIIPFVVLGAAACFIPQVSSRIHAITDQSQNVSRIKIWKTALDMIKDHPLRGVGNGNFFTYYNSYSEKYHYLTDYQPTNRLHPHNIFLKAQSELGVLGTAAFLGIFVSAFIKLVRFIKTEESELYNPFYTGFIASFIAFLSLNMVDNFFSAPKVAAFFWILLAIPQSIKYNNKNRINQI